MKTGAKDGGGEPPAQQRAKTDTETPFPSAKIFNIAAASSDGGFPIYIACVEKGKRVCTQCPVTNPVSPLRLLWRLRNFPAPVIWRWIWPGVAAISQW